MRIRPVPPRWAPPLSPFCRFRGFRGHHSRHPRNTMETTMSESQRVWGLFFRTCKDAPEMEVTADCPCARKPPISNTITTTTCELRRLGAFGSDVTSARARRWGSQTPAKMTSLPQGPAVLVGWVTWLMMMMMVMMVMVMVVVMMMVMYFSQQQRCVMMANPCEDAHERLSEAMEQMTDGVLAAV